MGDGAEAPLMEAAPRSNKAQLARCISHAQDELRSFRTWLRWMCVDQSNAWTACLSWSLYLLLGVAVPLLSHYVLACRTCDGRHARPYDAVVQLSLSAVAALSFFCLSAFVRRYGLRRFLFFDKLYNESETVRHEYTVELNRSLKLILVFVLPCFAAECAYKVWWYASGASQIPFMGSAPLSDAVACALELLSWLYRTTVFFLVCVLFRLICHLQILRLKDFARVFQEESDVESVLREHLRIRRHMRIISHRYRSFILLSLIFVTASQFASLLHTTRTHAGVSIFLAGELALCSVTLVTGLFILMRSAIKITHKVQSVTNLAAKWHVCATIDAFDTEAETPAAHIISRSRSSPAVRDNHSDDDSGDEGDDEESTKLLPAYAYTTISFQKRQALVTYFENNRAGISVYGFMLDRTSLQLIFGTELSLVLWLLGKTIGIS